MQQQFLRIKESNIRSHMCLCLFDPWHVYTRKNSNPTSALPITSRAAWTSPLRCRTSTTGSREQHVSPPRTPTHAHVHQKQHVTCAFGGRPEWFWRRNREIGDATPLKRLPSSCGTAMLPARDVAIQRSQAGSECSASRTMD
jgi:hypothetical protein